MSPVKHTFISTIVSAVFHYFTRSLPATVVCFLSGIFIDVDHILDYYIHRTHVTLNYEKLVDFCGREKAGRLYLFFHSYEIWFTFALVIMIYPVDLVWIALWIGVAAHMLADQLSNGLRPYAYFLTYRMKHGFDKKYLFTEEEYNTMR
jgi:hypothetical protein